MSIPITSKKALVSVIIPCYNHGRYLTTAIQSIYAQTYPFYEIIVVDDGSIDDTSEIRLTHPKVIYIHQQNSGLSSARNKGIKHAKGEYLVFLDADDWLLDSALEINLQVLENNTTAAFVSGGYELYHEPSDKTWVIQQEISGNYYCELIKKNFIGMHATVMYRSWVFEKFFFDRALKYCEDYDLYLKIAKRYPIIYHTQLIAVYRKHDNNMSANFAGMLDFALKVLASQKESLKTREERESYTIGTHYWKSYYSRKIYENAIEMLYNGDFNLDKKDIKILKKYNKPLYKKFTEYLQEVSTKKNEHLSEFYPNNAMKNLFRKFKRSIYSKRKEKVNFGDFNRITPFSTQFGYDRGGPIDRYYIENFLNEHASQINGRVLEIGDNTYTLKFGGEKVAKSDILHIDDSNEQATFVGDLSNAPHLPSTTFDCIILTQTLHLIYDFKGAIETCYRLLKPGGALLITVPGISHIAQDGWGKYWLWSFTDASMQRIIEECFIKDNIVIKTYGNVLVASAFLYGMGLPEMKQEQMDENDPHYQVIITVKAIK